MIENIIAVFCVVWVIVWVGERLHNAYRVWKFNQTASFHDPRKVDQDWNWK